MAGKETKAKIGEMISFIESFRHYVQFIPRLLHQFPAPFYFCTLLLCTC